MKPAVTNCTEIFSEKGYNSCFIWLYNKYTGKENLKAKDIIAPAPVNPPIEPNKNSNPIKVSMGYFPILIFLSSSAKASIS